MIATGKVEELDVEEPSPFSEFIGAISDGWMTMNSISKDFGLSYGSTQQRLSGLLFGGHIDRINAIDPNSGKTVFLYRHKSGSNEWSEIRKGKYAFIEVPNHYKTIGEIAYSFNINRSTVSKICNNNAVDYIYAVIGTEKYPSKYINISEFEKIYNEWVLSGPGSGRL